MKKTTRRPARKNKRPPFFLDVIFKQYRKYRNYKRYVRADLL
jgi:hypothetical protein